MEGGIASSEFRVPNPEFRIPNPESLAAKCYLSPRPNIPNEPAGLPAAARIGRPAEWQSHNLAHRVTINKLLSLAA